MLLAQAVNQSVGMGPQKTEGETGAAGPTSHLTYLVVGGLLILQGLLN